MSTKPFIASMFTATEFTTAQEKSDFANALAAFVKAKCPRHRFTKPMYRHLSHCFGHIAHYNIHGFYGNWFATDEGGDATYFLENALAWNCPGDAAYTFSDVEREFQKWIKKNFPGIRPRRQYGQCG